VALIVGYHDVLRILSIIDNCLTLDYELNLSQWTHFNTWAICM